MILLKEASRLFNSKELSEFANGNLNLFAKVALRYKDSLGDYFQAKSVFEKCYKDFENNYKTEYLFKNIITKKILLGRHSLNTSTMANELRVGANKADCVIFNGNSTCYEIKSEYDNLNRLPDQLNSYLKIFDKVYVVTTEKYCEKIRPSIPEAVGIIELNPRNNLTEVKKAAISKASLDIDILMSSIRKNEYLAIVKKLFGEVPKTSNTKTYDTCMEMLNKADSKSIRKAFCETLKKTRKQDKDFILQLPETLLTAGIEYNLSAANKSNLIQNLNTTLSKEAICTIRSSEENAMN